MKVVVTGGAGFIGRHLAKACVDREWETWILDNRSTDIREPLPRGAILVEGDIRDSSILQSVFGDAQIIFHLAAIASMQGYVTEWSDCSSINGAGTISVFDAASKAQSSPVVVYASSAAVYGNSENPRQGEIDECRPLSPYGLDKLYGERQAQLFGQLTGLRTCGLRLFNVYGPGQHSKSAYSGVITKFVASAIERRPLTIFGDGLQTRDFVHVHDVVRVILDAKDMCSVRGPVFNVGTGKAQTIRNLANTVSHVTGANYPIKCLPSRPGDIRESCASIDKLLAAIPDFAPISLEAGIRQFLEATGFSHFAGDPPPLSRSALIKRNSKEDYDGEEEFQT